MKSFSWHETDSFLHRLNPLTKLVLTLPVVILVSFMFEPVTPLVIALIFVLATRVLGRVPWRAIIRPFAIAVLLSVGMLWTGTVFYAGPGSEAGSPAHWIGPLRITDAGIVYGLAMAARLVAIFATSTLFVLTTDPTKFVLALIQQGRLPFRLGYGVFAAYRFVPLLQEEFANVRAAYQMRGGTEGNGLVGRIRESIGYAVPLMAIAVRKGERVALAMDSRAFGALPHRTYYRQTSIGRDDVMFALGASATLVAIVMIRAMVIG
ncbi:MAG TPA: energy-coupling factor transporter transmembrane component T [Chloroflexota bacterium]|nr:energy-coupling factor transporter transmembrane component T [Chloroflexota bacterium]